MLSYGYLLLMLVFVIVPVWWMVWISLNPHNTLFTTSYTLIPPGATFKHYVYAINNTPFLLWLRNSIIVAFGTTFLGIVLAITAAYGYSRFNFKGKKGTMMLFLVVQMFPGVIVLIPYYLIMYNLGLINTFIGLIIAYSVTAIPLIVWMSKGFFDSIPKSIDEAAMVDGCTRFQAFLKVVLPLAAPGIAVAALFSFITAWNEFVLAYTFMSEENYTLPVGIMQFIGLTGSTSSQWGVFAAVSIMVSIPVVLVFLSLQKYLISGMTTGSVKG
ncbi:MAG: sugar ABC transporter permease [Euryarchaeota archaeon]|nr:sugar ABC transporter permease [Euryarchaeota archaeon]